jgi:hypothetical protein
LRTILANGAGIVWNDAACERFHAGSQSHRPDDGSRVLE